MQIKSSFELVVCESNVDKLFVSSYFCYCLFFHNALCEVLSHSADKFLFADSCRVYYHLLFLWRLFRAVVCCGWRLFVERLVNSYNLL